MTRNTLEAFPHGKADKGASLDCLYFPIGLVGRSSARSYVDVTLRVCLSGQTVISIGKLLSALVGEALTTTNQFCSQTSLITQTKYYNIFYIITQIYYRTG